MMPTCRLHLEIQFSRGKRSLFALSDRGSPRLNLVTAYVYLELATSASQERKQVRALIGRRKTTKRKNATETRAGGRAATTARIFERIVMSEGGPYRARPGEKYVTSSITFKRGASRRRARRHSFPEKRPWKFLEPERREKPSARKTLGEPGGRFREDAKRSIARGETSAAAEKRNNREARGTRLPSGTSSILGQPASISRRSVSRQRNTFRSIFPFTPVYTGDLDFPDYQSDRGKERKSPGEGWGRDGATRGSYKWFLWPG